MFTLQTVTACPIDKFRGPKPLFSSPSDGQGGQAPENKDLGFFAFRDRTPSEIKGLHGPRGTVHRQGLPNSKPRSLS